MELLHNLFMGFPNLWGGGVAHSVMILSLVISLGLLLGKIKVANISLGLTWVLFVGITFGYFCFNLDEHLLHFLKEFGLILFVYSLGLQVGPSFFSSFGKGGLRLNMLAISTIAISIVVTVILFYTTGTPITTMAGILSGAVTNTPGLGAAQQANSDLNGIDDPSIAASYASAYPIGVIGAILIFLLLKYILRIHTGKEEEAAKRGLGATEELTVRPFSVCVKNEQIVGRTVRQIAEISQRDFVISRMLVDGAASPTDVINGSTVLNLNDKLLITAAPRDIEAIIACLGEPTTVDWEKCDKGHISRRILITRPEINGKTLAQLRIRSLFGANITHVYRSGVELVAAPHLQLQMGDKVTVVGSELAISHTEKRLGNSIKRLNIPNLIPIFLGIALGCLVANIPFYLPGIQAPLKLGLTGGPLVVAILIGFLGPKFHLITYNTISSNLMIREIGLCIFLACVGLGTGKEFIDTVFNGNGLAMVGYGAIITMLPLLIGGLIGRYAFHLNYYTLIGVLAGANTNPPALRYANDLTASDSPAVAYSTVYPFAMFLRIITIQILILTLG